MAFNFPSSPNIGDIHAESGRQYKYNGYSWVIVPATDVSGPISISDTPPSNPQAGDAWFESDTGNLYVYYRDIDSAQWLQVGGSGDLATLDYLPLSGGALSGNVSFNGFRATDLPAPTNAQDAATKAYIDAKDVAIVADTPPSTNSNGETIQQGDLWYDMIGGRLYVYYNDGNTTQWVDASPEPPFDTAAAATNLVATLTAANDDIAAAVAGVAIGQMYLIPGGTTWNNVRVRLA